MSGSGASKAWTGLAVDLGASGGRVLAGRYDGSKLSYTETHRFVNEPVQVIDTLQWDILRLYHEIQTGFIQAARLNKQSGDGEIRSVGIDSWAVDFGLLDKAGKLLGNPVHYRDKRNDGMMDKVFATVPKDEVFRRTGIQFLPFNTIYQLAAMKEIDDPQLEQASALLMIPDLLQYFLTGEKAAEFTNATSTQLYDPVRMDWSHELIARLGLPDRLFQRIVQPGTEIGGLLPTVADALGLPGAHMVATATHDTGAAVAAVPSQAERFAYISCGTWSLLGTEVRQPVLNDRALELNFTNEGGVNGTFRLLKNIMGLWLLQETKRQWEREGTKFSWDEMTKLAAQAAPFTAFIDPDDDMFMPPGDMPGRIREYCRRTGQQAPQSEGALLRCVTESLALKYRWVLEKLEELADSRMDVVHMVGGGIQNEQLCRWTAAACGRPVVAGPVEASAIGNLTVQLMSAGEVANLSEARSLIADSFPMRVYEPEEVSRWDEAYGRFRALLNL